MGGLTCRNLPSDRVQLRNTDPNPECERQVRKNPALALGARMGVTCRLEARVAIITCTRIMLP